MSSRALSASSRSSQLGFHATAALRAAAYLLAGLPLGLLYLVALAAAPLADGDVLRRPLSVERSLLNGLLRARIPPVPDDIPRTAAVPLAARLPGAVVGLAAAAAPVAVAAFVATESIRSLAAGGDRYLGPWALDRPAAALALLLVLPAAILCVAALETAGTITRRLVRRTLARAVEGGAVRDALAESLGDRTLAIAYWLPERGEFVDEHGHPVELPEPGSGRSWTAVENGGRRVAAIVHDAGAGGAARARACGGHRSCARARERAAEGRPACPAPGAAPLAPADRPGELRGAAPSRARPSRRRAAAARHAVDRSAAVAERGSPTRRYERSSKRPPRSSPWRCPSSASSPAASTRRFSPTVASARRSRRWRREHPSRSSSTSRSRAGCRRAWRRLPTSSAPRR